MRTRLLLPLSLLAACAQPEIQPPGPDASTPACTTLLCGARCCPLGEVCFAEACCTPTSCSGRECGDDGCGTACGTCGTGSRCDRTSFRCVACSAETPAGFCARQATAGLVCGAIAGTDPCTGADRLEDCGGCTNGRGCAPDHTCTAPVTESREQFCARLQADCGSVTDPDSSPPRTENCGQCPPEQDCLGNVCTGCVPEDHDAFCARQVQAGLTCGVITATDSCGAARTEDCGAGRCLGTDICDTATHSCRACPEQSDAELCARDGKDCGDHPTTDACGRSRTPNCGGPCAAGLECLDNTCTNPAAPANDRCSAVGPGSPWDLTPAFLANGVFVEGATTVPGSTTAARDDSAGACETSYALQDGGDVVYRLSIPPGAGEHLLRATVERSPSATGFFPAVYLRTACDDTTAEVACAGYDSGGTAEAVLPQAGPGTWFVIVDGEEGSQGDFSLTLTSGPAVRVPGCPGDTLVFDAAGRASAGSDTSLAPDHTTTGCGDAGGGDVAYQFTVPAGRRVNLTASATPTAGSELHPALALRSVCSQAASERACGIAPDVGEPASLNAQGLGPGTYYLIVDSAPGDEGAFTLAAAITESPPAPSNDTCATPDDLGPLDGASVTRALDTSGASDDLGGDCGGEPMTGGDVVFRFSLAARASVTAHVIPDSQSPGFTPVVLVAGQCPVPGAGLRCGAAPDPGGEATVFLRDLQPGTYFLVVDGVGGTFGQAQLTLTAGAPVILPDGCATEQAIPLTGLDAEGNGTLTVLGDTTDAADDQRSIGRCGTGGGADLVYSLTLGASKDVVVSLAYDDPNSDPVLYLRRGACDTLDPSDELGCADYQIGASLRVLRLPPGTYHLWADSYSGAAGSFTLTIQIVDPTPAPENDTCLGAVPALVFQGGHATLTGDTAAASADGHAGCALADGPDLVYRVDVPPGAPQSLSVSVDAASGSDLAPVVSLHSSCDDPTGLGELGCGTAVWGGATATANTLAPGSYWVWVGGSHGSAGAFELDATLGPPLTGPGNDACPGAQPVSIDPVSGIGTATGTTAGGNDDSASVGCGSGDEDVVFAFSLGAPQKVTVTATPDVASGDFQPVLSLRRECGVYSAASEVVCSAAPGSGDAASAIAWSLPAGTYFAWVDSLFEAGGFTLEVKLEPPVAAPANDACRGAEPVGLPTTLQGSTFAATGDYGSTLSSTCQGAAWGDAPGREVVYAYTPAADGDFTVVVTPAGGWDALLWYTTGACGSASACVDASDLGFDDQAEELTIAGVAGVTYFFYVDARDPREAGDFAFALY